MDQRSGAFSHMTVRWAHSERTAEQILAGLRWRGFDIRYLGKESLLKMEEPLQKPLGWSAPLGS